MRATSCSDVESIAVEVLADDGVVSENLFVDLICGGVVNSRVDKRCLSDASESSSAAALVSMHTNKFVVKAPMLVAASLPSAHFARHLSGAPSDEVAEVFGAPFESNRDES